MHQWLVSPDFTKLLVPTNGLCFRRDLSRDPGAQADFQGAVNAERVEAQKRKAVGMRERWLGPR
jgi:hypothetical protein